MKRTYLRCFMGLKCTDLKKAYQGGTTSSGGCRIALLSSLQWGEPTRQEVLPLSINIKCFTPPAGGSLTQQRTAGLFLFERRGWLNISTFSTRSGTWDVLVSVFNETSHQIISVLSKLSSARWKDTFLFKPLTGEGACFKAVKSFCIN